MRDPSGRALALIVVFILAFAFYGYLGGWLGGTVTLPAADPMPHGPVGTHTHGTDSSHVDAVG